MQFEEHALSFPCHGEQLLAILSVPAQPGARGVLVVVGGPQYRAGSHRQFTLLARSLAAQGVPVLRFDYRGMGDSEGAQRDFEQVDADLRSAVDQMFAALPALREVVLWGLCDAASAALFYGPRDERVGGLVLLNPWVRSDEGLAKATLKHYYRDRLLQPELWRKIFSGRFRFGAALASLLRLLKTAFGGAAATTAADSGPADAAPAGLRERMYQGLARFQGKVLLITSGADLTAQEFNDMVDASRPWQRQLAAPRVTRQRLDGADHTFSRRVWRDQVADWTAGWMRSW